MCLARAINEVSAGGMFCEANAHAARGRTVGRAVDFARLWPVLGQAFLSLSTARFRLPLASVAFVSVALLLVNANCRASLGCGGDCCLFPIMSVVCAHVYDVHSAGDSSMPAHGTHLITHMCAHSVGKSHTRTSERSAVHRCVNESLLRCGVLSHLN